MIGVASAEKSPFMDKRYTLTLLLMFFFTSALFAQAGKEVFTLEALVCDSTGAAIKDVAVYDAKNNLRSVTDHDGIARIATRLGETLYLSHLSFKKQAVRIEAKSLIDNEDGRKSMLVVMQRKTNTIAEVTVTENAPHLAYENKMVWVVDYKVQDDGIYMVAGNGVGYALLHLGFEQDSISCKSVSSKFQELYRDAFGNLHLVSGDSIYQVYCDGRELHLLYGNSKETFRQKLKPVVATTDSLLVLEVRKYYGQEVAFVAVNRNNGQRFVLEDISGATVEMARNWHLDNYREALMEAANLESNDDGNSTTTMFSRDYKVWEDAAGEVSNLSASVKQRLMLRSVYCPLIGIGNELYLFAFPTDELYVFDNIGQLQRKTELDFHKFLGEGLSKHLVSSNPWDKNLIFDPVRKMVYAQFKGADGIVTLKEVDLGDGKTKREIRLSRHAFPQNIQVYDGEVYYLFLDNRQAGQDRRSLYKMRLE